MNTYVVSFFGHRHINNPIPIEATLEMLIGSLLRNKQYVEFLVGRDGDFDLLVSSVIHRCQRKIRKDNSAHVWILPYTTAEYSANEAAFRAYYNEIEICETAASVHFKAAFQVRNRKMVDRSDLVVFYVERKSGGAYQTMRYAQKQGVTYRNIKDEQTEV